MRSFSEENGESRIELDPGEFHVVNSDKDVVISTLLGSCISTCLYDPVHRIMGMNHFLLSNRRYMRNGPLVTTEAGRYGIQAMELLIERMLKIGASSNYLKAKAFGGGSIHLGGDNSSNFFCVGEVNSRFIVEYLNNENIPLESSDLGGNKARLVKFHAKDFSVYVQKIKSAETVSVVERDKNYWTRRVKENEAKATEIDLW